jgi:hypothetical protein
MESDLTGLTPFWYCVYVFMNYVDRLAALGAAIPELLLPAPEIDLSKWAVIACDQATQDRLYWDRVRSFAGDAPSSLNLIFPEVYLEDAGRKDRIASIHRTMKEYLDKGIFAPPQKTLVYVERDTPFYQTRRGLILALDLERYDWKADSAPLIRPTEGTVSERLPPRMEIRRNAPLETPHILILINDEENTLLPALGERAKNAHVFPVLNERTSHTPASLYDTELMLEAGRVKGWKLDKEADWEFLASGLETLQNKAAAQNSEPPFLFAVGDGNHSLAAAKAVWEEYKAAHRDDPAIMNHSARWALVELENLYDPALAFEPIHRLLLGAGAVELPALLALLQAQLPGYACHKPANTAELAALVEDEHCSRLRLGIASGPDCFLVEAGAVPLAVDAIQPLLDAFVEEQRGKVTIDYIHGKDELFRLAGANLVRPAGTAEAPGANDTAGTGATAAGILLPPFRKQGLFETVAKRGPLPRKSFSMGESCEKRFYLECRKLFC